MAELTREGEHLVLILSTIEMIEGLHGDISVPVVSVQSVQIVDDVIQAVHGLKLPGSALPGVFAVGTFVSSEGSTFAVVHHNTKRGVKINLANASYDVLVVGVDDPEGLVINLGL